MRRANIAVDDDGDRNPLFDGPHRGPIGLAFEELLSRTPVHGNQLNAGRLGTARELRRIPRCVVPTETHLQRHRNPNGANDGVDERQRMIEIAH